MDLENTVLITDRTDYAWFSGRVRADRSKGDLNEQVRREQWYGDYFFSVTPVEYFRD
jgi:hypothetical protein